MVSLILIAFGDAENYQLIQRDLDRFSTAPLPGYCCQLKVF